MQKVFSKPAELEKLAKEKFSVPPFFMMENAARAMADFVLSKKRSLNSSEDFHVLVVCGKGNNGGDGYAMARMIYKECKVHVIALEKPTAEEACAQYEKCVELGIEISNHLPETIRADLIVDCIYGIGFHGELKPEVKDILDKLNACNATRLACDVPSAFYFKADYTITMGEQKTILLSDKAKAASGEITVANLGLARSDFESCSFPDAHLIEESDIKLPVRKNKAAHKGTYGHTSVFACNKAGAAIIAGTAAMNFGSGLTTLVKTAQTDLEQFKISPELMISNSLPAKTTAVVIGPGIVEHTEKDNQIFSDWFKSAKNPAAVVDAGMFSWPAIAEDLTELNKVPNGRIVLTPHLQEFCRFLERVLQKFPDCGITAEDLQTSTLANKPESKIRLGKILNRLYPHTTVIIKSANTFIASGGEIFVVTAGCQSLAKGGSGDVLAGMVGALLAQSYTAKDAAITAVMRHALAARELGEEAYNLTPFKLIEQL